MSERFIPEKPEVNITENSGNDNESNERSRADEADSAKKSFSSDHAPRKRTASVCSDFSDIEIFGIETHVTKNRKEKQFDELVSTIKSSSIQETVIHDPKQGGKTSNTAREEVDIGSEDTSLKDVADELFETPNILKALPDEEMLEDNPETLDGELHARI